ncbi:MAG: DUF1588 domain-containing protein [Myxococcota bacterium]
MRLPVPHVLGPIWVVVCTACNGLIGDTEPRPLEPLAPPPPIILKSSAPRTLSNTEYRKSLSSLLGYDIPASLFEGWTPSLTFSGFDGVLWSGFSGKATQDRIATVEALIDGVVASPRVMICEPEEASGQACATRILERFVPRAFRRPLQANELAELTALYRDGFMLAEGKVPSARDQFHEGLRVVIASVLLSPQLMVRVEPLPAEGERDLDAYELATRLAFFMTGAPPDDELWLAAETGALLEVDVLRAHAMRLLFTRTADFVDTFMGQLFDFRQLATAPADSLKHDFYRESSLVLGEIVAAELPASSLVAPGFTYLNPALATHYGVGPPSYAFTSDDFLRFETNERGGILQQGSVLSLTSTETKTSPTRRGRWVQGRLLCKTIPPPGPELLEQITAVSASIPADATVKQRVDAHRSAGPACAGCHQYMDPIGLGLETFDMLGKTRAYYDQAATRIVETASELLGTPFTTFAELNVLLAAMPDVNTCLAEKMVVHGLGQMPAADDEGLIFALSAPVDGHDPSFADLVERFVTSTPFRRIARPGATP